MTATSVFHTYIITCTAGQTAEHIVHCGQWSAAVPHDSYPKQTKWLQTTVYKKGTRLEFLVSSHTGNAKLAHHYNDDKIIPGHRQSNSPCSHRCHQYWSGWRWLYATKHKLLHTIDIWLFSEIIIKKTLHLRFDLFYYKHKFKLYCIM